MRTDVIAHSSARSLRCHTVIGSLAVLLSAAAHQACAAPHLDYVDNTVVPQGETMAFTGSGFSNVVSVSLYWASRTVALDFTNVTDSTMDVAMGEPFQDMRAQRAIVQTPDAATVTVPPGYLSFSGTGTVDASALHWSSTIVVRAGAQLMCGSELDSSAYIHVESGGALELCGPAADWHIFAEDNAVVDLSGVTALGSVDLLHSPAAILIGDAVTNEQLVARFPLPSLTASYDIPLFYMGRRLEVTTNGPGAVVREPPGPYHPPYSNVRLTAVPQSNRFFTGWSGHVSGTQSSVVVHIERDDLAVQANFAEGYVLERHVTPGGAIQVVPDADAFAPGSEVTVLARPDPDHEFVGWLDALTGTAPSNTLTMDANRRIFAAFRPTAHAHRPLLTSVDRSVAREGDTVQITGQALTNVTAVQLRWANRFFTASFTPRSETTLDFVMPPVAQDIRAHQPLVATAQGTTLSIGPSVKVYDGGPPPFSDGAYESLLVPRGTILAMDGSDLSHDLVYVEAGAALIMHEQPSLAFGRRIYVEDGAFFWVTGEPHPYMLPELGLTHSPGASIRGLVPDGPHTLGSITVVPSLAACTNLPFFYFGRTVDIATVGTGHVTRKPEQPYYIYRQDVKLTAHPDAGANFLGWSGDASGTGTSITYRVLQDDVSITAAFTSGFVLDRIATAGGTIEATPSAAMYAPGSTVTVFAVAATGYTFAAWTGDISATAAVASVVMDGHRTVRAGFDVANRETLPRVDRVTATLLTPGDVLHAHGSGLTGTVQAAFYRDGSGESATATPGTNGWIQLTVPEIRRGAGPLLLFLETPTGSTATLPPYGQSFWPTSKVDDVEDETLIVVEPGAVFDPASALLNHPTVYVRAGGMYILPENIVYTLTLAEDGAMLDVRNVEQGSGARVLLSPTAHMIGSPLTNLEAYAVSHIDPLRASTNIGPFQVGYPLAIAIEGSGMVHRLPDQAFYAHRDSVQLRAEGLGGQTFLRWLGDAEGTSSQTTVRVYRNMQITARFAAQSLSYASWRLLHFTAVELADPEISGIGADPDRDGYTNGAEYMFNTHPRQPSEAERIRVRLGDVDGQPAFLCEYVRPIGCADVAFRVECSRDGVHWTWNDDGSGERVTRTIGWTSSGLNGERVTVQLFPDAPSVSRVFTRVHAEIMSP